MSAARSGPVGAHANRFGTENVDLNAGLLQLGDDRAEVSRVAVGDDEVAAGDGAGDEEGARLDAIGIDAVARAVEAGYALDGDGGGACSLNVRAHGGEQRGEVGDFRLAGAVFHHGFALGQNGGHEQVLSAGDGDLVEDQVRAAEAVGAGFKVAVLLGDDGAHFFQALDVQVDGPAADGAAAGHGDARHAGAGHQRAQHQGTGAHGFHDFVAGDGIGERAATDGDAIVGAAFALADFRAHGGEQLALGLDVADLGNVFERDLVLSEDGGGHAGEGGVFCARDADGAHQRIAAANDEFIHKCLALAVVSSLSNLVIDRRA